ncbi:MULTISPECIES: hypothetical protein [Arenibacter]|uniref:hypothetical protein n=1 Tax=Arenibacter TaxID=178469 RepID=UPI001863B652|nr:MULTISPECIES: hypothetical protein [Arenibacter]
MYRRILIICLLFTAMTVKAHQADVSTTMLVEKQDNSWVLQISASLTAFQHEIRTHFADTPYQTPEEFQQMVLEHIKNNLHISFNGVGDISFSNGVVILGHETKVVFEVFGIPSEINSVLVKNSAFKDIHKNQSALFLFKEGFSKEQFVLNEANNHTLALEVSGNKFVEAGHNEASIFSSSTAFVLLGVSAIVVLGLSVLGLGFLFKKFKRRKEIPLTIIR